MDTEMNLGIRKLGVLHILSDEKGNILSWTAVSVC